MIFFLASIPFLLGATTPETPPLSLTPPVEKKKEPQTAVEYYPDDTVESETPVDDFGLRHGLRREYFASGGLKSERTYRHGTLHGPSRLYYPKGSLRTELHYKVGKRHGMSFGYYRDGTLKDKGLYQEDLLQGRVFLYYPSGKRKAEMVFENNKLQGLSATYFESGKTRNLLTYQEGRLIKMETYDKEGEQIREQEFPQSLR